MHIDIETIHGEITLVLVNITHKHALSSGTEFPNVSGLASWWGWVGEKGWLHMSSWQAHTQLYLHKWHACKPVAHANGMHTHTCPLLTQVMYVHTHSLAISTAQLQNSGLANLTSSTLIHLELSQWSKLMESAAKWRNKLVWMWIWALSKTICNPIQWQ